jgi:hypothetical protein
MSQRYRVVMERQKSHHKTISPTASYYRPSRQNARPYQRHAAFLLENRETCHFYIEHTPNYSKTLGYQMQLLDMGIAMCQFELACDELGISGNWVIDEPGLERLNENIEYVVSWNQQ